MFKNQVKIFLGVLVASTVRAIPDGAGECPGCEFGSSGFCQNDGNICIAPDGDCPKTFTLCPATTSSTFTTKTRDESQEAFAESTLTDQAALAKLYEEFLALGGDPNSQH
eukprot:gene10349-28176_t